MMIVTTVFDKRIDSLRPRRRGPHGHAFVAVIRLLVYALFARFPTTRGVVAHVQARPEVWRALGFAACPTRRAVDKWKRRYQRRVLPRAIAMLGDEYALLTHPDWTLVDSTPLEDKHDGEARWGKTSRGWFCGYKLHMSTDEKSVPLRATFTSGEVHDSRPAGLLFAPTPCVGGDSAYDNKRLTRKARRQGSVAHFVPNPRNNPNDTRRTHPALGKVRSAIERANNLVKNEVMQRAWTRVKGFATKAAMALCAVLALQALALYTLRERAALALRISEVRR